MGSQQSKPAEYSDEKTLERLRKLSVQDEGEYVQISGGGGDEKAAARASSSGPMLVRQPEGISVGSLEFYIDDLLDKPKNRLAMNALSSCDPKQALQTRSTKIADKHVFNTMVPFEGAPITNQRSSGRCWLFAATNVFRTGIMKKHNLESFELSQAYLFYWDKLEKSNHFLEQMIATAHEDLDSRIVSTLTGDPASDGGQWDMVFNLVQKYGLVPQDLYPDSFNAKSSGVLNSVLRIRLRECGLRLRRLSLTEEARREPEVLRRAKAEMMQSITLIVTVLLGAPPKPSERFSWTFKDKDGKVREVRATPRDFAQDIYSADFKVSAATVERMVSLVNDPRHPRNRKLTVDRLGNVVGGRGVTYVNVEMETMKAACVKMLRAGLCVFFGSDVGQFSDSATGIMDLDLYDYESGLDVKLWAGMSKAERLATGESCMTHAMVLTGVHVDERSGRPVRWRVQNSWGTASGENGWFVMDDAWADQFVYQAVIDERMLPKEVRDVLKQEPIKLPLWDPMGTLA